MELWFCYFFICNGNIVIFLNIKQFIIEVDISPVTFSRYFVNVDDEHHVIMHCTSNYYLFFNGLEGKKVSKNHNNSYTGSILYKYTAKWVDGKSQLNSFIKSIARKCNIYIRLDIHVHIMFHSPKLCNKCHMEFKFLTIYGLNLFPFEAIKWKS